MYMYLYYIYIIYFIFYTYVKQKNIRYIKICLNLHLYDTLLFYILKIVELEYK